MRWCWVTNGVVTNIIKWNGVAPLALPDGVVLVLHYRPVTMGWLWDGETFIDPAAPE